MRSRITLSPFPQELRSVMHQPISIKYSQFFTFASLFSRNFIETCFVLFFKLIHKVTRATFRNISTIPIAAIATIPIGPTFSGSCSKWGLFFQNFIHIFTTEMISYAREFKEKREDRREDKMEGKIKGKGR